MVFINYLPPYNFKNSLTSKTHKCQIPVRPIISSIDSMPHKITKSLAEILVPLLGMISSSHIKNSSDLCLKMNNINMNNKPLASLDIKTLFTNFP